MKERKEKKKWGIMLFIAFIMVGTSFSFVFFGFNSQGDVIRYKGIKFVKYLDRWEAKVNGRLAAFTFLPTEVQDINYSLDLTNKLKYKFEVDVTSDLNSTHKESIALAQHQMGLTLAQYNIFVRKGFTTNNNFNLPVITCDDATSAVPVVYFRQGNSTNIQLDGNCIVAEANTGFDFVKVKDRLLYEMLGVLDD